MRQRDDHRLDPLVTLADWLNVVQPRLPGALIAPEAWERLHALALDLPGDGQAALEFRLAPGPLGPVDLSFRIDKPSQARRLSGGPRGFLDRWSAGEFDRVSAVWLEFDLDRSPSPVPCAKLAGEVEPAWLLEVLLPALHGPLTPPQRGLARRCLAEIPPPGVLLYAFSLRPRGTDHVRLEILGLDPPAMLGYLETVAPGVVPEFKGIAPLFEGVERLHLSLDLGEEISPRFGVEGSFPRLPHREPGWRALFARLEERGLCDPAKREAVLAWPGHDSFWTAPRRWPVAEAGGGGYCVRSLSHVKVAGQVGRPPEAKAYLLVTPWNRESA